jgi:hypothetical protein
MILRRQLSDPDELGKCGARSVGNSIFWEDREGQRFELKLDLDRIRIATLKRRDGDGMFS